MSKYTMFIDETGTVNGTGFFGVVGVIFKDRFAYNEDKTITPLLKQKLDQFKMDCFGKSDFIFHLEKITNGKKPFRTEDGVTRGQLKKFYNDLPTFLQDLDFQIIFVSIDKKTLNDYFISPKDPYVVAIAHIMKSFISIIKNPLVESARIVFESRDDKHDFQIQKAFFDVFNSGTVHLEITDEIRNKIRGLIFLDEENYHPGLEIADLLCSPLSRVERGLVELNPKRIKYGQVNRIFPLIEPKIYIGRIGHSTTQWGFKKVPVI